ncbi:hypothetical protein NSPZN2_11530 [Nitrospira defluvii]|uniref:Uncharacterized protein n=1 Tax=Nitrospira defluvii TaxID=330214 RepID=A0ABM8QVH3_9BACT|nr:hypothetical protein NSPZN2_11530 [Nitrospira defluvii]
MTGEFRELFEAETPPPKPHADDDRH